MFQAATCLILTTLPATLTQGAAPLPQAQRALDLLPSFGWMFLRMIIVLVVLLAALLLAARWLARKARNRPLGGRGKCIEVVEIHPLEPRKRLYLVRVAGQFFLIGSSEGRLQTLAGDKLDSDALAAALENPDQEAPAAASRPPARSFAELLKPPATERKT